MGQITDQVHSKFKVFAGELQPDNTLGPLADQVTRFVRDSKVAPKSIGVEYLEASKRLIITLGYREDEGAYGVRLTCVALGKIDAFSNDFAALEAAMTNASRDQGDILCHELYVTGGHDLLMIFMTHQG